MSDELQAPVPDPNFIDPDEAPDESKRVAERLYHGIHPALEAIGMTYVGAARDVQVELIQKAARLRAVLDYDEQKIASVLNIIFGAARD